MQEKQMDIMNPLIFILRELPILQMRTMNASRRLVVLCGSIAHLYHIDRPVLLDLLVPPAHTTYLAPITPFDPLIHKSEDPFNIIYPVSPLVSPQVSSFLPAVPSFGYYSQGRNPTDNC